MTALIVSAPKRLDPTLMRHPMCPDCEAETQLVPKNGVLIARCPWVTAEQERHLLLGAKLLGHKVEIMACGKPLDTSRGWWDPEWVRRGEVKVP